MGNTKEIDNPAGNDPNVGTAAQTTYSYTNDNLVKTVTAANPSPNGGPTVAADTYNYDADGRATQSTDAVGLTTTTWTRRTGHPNPGPRVATCGSAAGVNHLER